MCKLQTPSTPCCDGNPAERSAGSHFTLGGFPRAQCEGRASDDNVTASTASHEHTGDSHTRRATSVQQQQRVCTLDCARDSGGCRGM